MGDEVARVHGVEHSTEGWQCDRAISLNFKLIHDANSLKSDAANSAVAPTHGALAVLTHFAIASGGRTEPSAFAALPPYHDRDFASRSPRVRATPNVRNGWEADIRSELFAIFPGRIAGVPRCLSLRFRRRSRSRRLS